MYISVFVVSDFSGCGCPVARLYSGLPSFSCVCVSFVMLLMVAVGRLRIRRSTRYLTNTHSSLQGRAAILATCI